MHLLDILLSKKGIFQYESDQYWLYFMNRIVYQIHRKIAEMEINEVLSIEVS